MERIKNPTKKIAQTIKTGSVSATFGIIVITLMLIFAGWSIYEKYKAEGLIGPVFRGEENLVQEIIYEDTSRGVKEVTTIIER